MGRFRGLHISKLFNTSLLRGGTGFATVFCNGSSRIPVPTRSFRLQPRSVGGAMISALLLPLLPLPLPRGAGPAPPQPAATPHDDPPIQLWISSDRRFFPGERAKVQVRT